SGSAENRRCNLIRTKAAAYGGWGRLPPVPLGRNVAAILVIIWSLKSGCEGTLLLLEPKTSVHSLFFIRG
ncbi:MAG: hypothetical protein LUC48_09060, partial [Clostridiales bacterium]|nr:hypothetical protein [Clostridiales bacterium]